MEKLVDHPNITFRRFSAIWLVLAVIFFVIAVIMTALFIWMVAKPIEQPISLPKKPNPRTVGSPCPKQPPLLKLPTPLPKPIKDSLTLIDNYLKSLAKTAENKSAISVNIFYHDKVIWRGHYGSKVYKGSIPPDDNTRYRIGSVTKLFPVILLYKLNQDGVIASLDDPLNKYAPNFHINNPFTETNITLRQIANQMSGLPREAPCGYRCSKTNSTEQLALLKSQYLVVEPWTSPSYSNLGYALLGRLLTENLLNITFEEWVQKQVLQPLGMNDSGFQITEKVMENMALPYNQSGAVRPFMNIGWAAPAGAMYSTVNDLMKLATLFAKADGQGVLKRETIRQILLPDFLTRDGRWLWGSPWEMRFIEDFVARQKGGNIDSYNAVLSVTPEMELGLDVLINANFAFPYGSSTSFVIADVIHSILLPALNKTLFELRSKESFPVESKPFLGEYLVSKSNMSTGKVDNFTVAIKPDMDTLLVSVNNPINTGEGFLIKYIGKPLMFQGVAMIAVNSSCLVPHLGVLSIVKFDAPGPNGLSDGFSAPSWQLVAKRIKSENSKVVNNKEASLWSNDFFNDQPFGI